jgi:hypothetical protein
MSEPTQLLFPLSFDVKGQAATVQQESSEAHTNGAFNVAVCPQGFRDDSPEFGIADQSFAQVPLDLEALRQQIERWEPNANLTLEEVEELLGPAFRKVTIEVS